MNKLFTFRKIYFLIFTLVAVIGFLISFGNLVYQILAYNIISDKEYIYSSNQSYRLEQCLYNYTKSPEQQEETDSKKIQECEEKAKEQIVLSRSLDYKKSILQLGIRSVLFLILGLTHIPAFFRVTKED